MAEPGLSDGPPPFEDPFRAEDVEQRVYGTILQVREPTAAGAIAERAECDPKTARKYLAWFADLGIVTRHDGHPATYQRNDAYFEWRRIDELATDHTVEELTARVRELTSCIAEYEERYGAPSPGTVDALAFVDSRDDRTIDEAYRDLGDWATAREERRRYERARQHRVDAVGEGIPG